jgi:hypothetical protein
MSELNPSIMSGFTGTENLYRHLGGIVFTDGVKYVADTTGGYWLLDLIFSHQLDKKVRKEEFQVWKLEVTYNGNAAKAICEDGDGKAITTQDIEFTDFPAPGITLWFINKTILLPSEY